MTTGERRDQIRGRELRLSEILDVLSTQDVLDLLTGAITPTEFAASVYGTGTTTIDPDDTVSHGSSAALSRTDHQHAITAAAPSSIADTASNTEGSAANFARSDHGHAFVLGNMVDYVRVRRDATQSFTTATAAMISWDTEETDNGGWWTVGTPTRLTVPRAGIALVVANVDWDANTTERRRLSIILNGTTTLSSVRWDGVASENTQQVASTGWVSVAANDFFEAEARQDSGGNLNLGGQPTNFSALLIPT